MFYYTLTTKKLEVVKKMTYSVVVAYDVETLETELDRLSSIGYTIQHFDTRTTKTDGVYFYVAVMFKGD